MNFVILSKFALSDQLSDFKLKLPTSLQGTEIFAHKIILAANSDLFLKHFETEKDSGIYDLPQPINSYDGEVTSKEIETVLKFGYSE